ncbi:30S ribosomal protein S6 [Candidatus Berkelbacteria bacterium]|nr:30S ribosomal protein S6 [Candidatus Berkelbacteria bacterium]
MTHYEITCIHRDETEPGVLAAIEAVGGHLASNRSLGRRQLAYPIEKQTAGYYTTARMTLESPQVADLTKRLERMDGLIRYLLVSLPSVTASVDLEAGEELTEAKELGGDEKPAASQTPATAEKPDAAETERQQLLQEKLDKLLGDSQNETETK